jgi:hypothetical protein
VKSRFARSPVAIFCVLVTALSGCGNRVALQSNNTSADQASEILPPATVFSTEVEISLPIQTTTIEVPTTEVPVTLPPTMETPVIETPALDVPTTQSDTMSFSVETVRQFLKNTVDASPLMVDELVEKSPCGSQESSKAVLLLQQSSDPIVQPTLQLLGRTTRFDDGSRTMVVHNGDTFVSVTDRCGKPFSNEVVDRLLGQSAPSETTGSLTSRLDWLKIKGNTLAQPTKAEAKVISLLQSAIDAADLGFEPGPVSDFAPITWSDATGRHRMDLAVSEDRINYVMSDEIRKNASYSFGRAVDVLQTDGTNLPSDVSYVDEQQYLRAVSGKLPKAAKAASPATSGPCGTGNLKAASVGLPKSTPGALLPHDDSAFTVAIGRDVNSVTLTVENNGRVFAKVTNFPGTEPKPINWMVSPETVQSLLAKVNYQTLESLPHDNGDVGDWVLINVGGNQASAMMATNDEGHRQLCALTYEIFAELKGNITEHARPAVPTVIELRVDAEPVQLISKNDAPQAREWPLKRSPSEMFKPGSGKSCVAFQTTEAEKLWKVLDYWNSDQGNQQFYESNGMLWSAQFFAMDQGSNSSCPSS